MKDADFTPEWMLSRVLPLVRDEARLVAMAAAARDLGIRNGAERMCALIDQARASTVTPRALS